MANCSGTDKIGYSACVCRTGKYEKCSLDLGQLCVSALAMHMGTGRVYTNVNMCVCAGTTFANNIVHIIECTWYFSEA